MRVIQILPSLTYGDAISNEALEINKILLKLNIETMIYAENADKDLAKNITLLDKLKILDNNEVILYHNSIGSDINYKLKNYGGKCIMRYHNITPPRFFRNYNPKLEMLTNSGLADTRYLASKNLIAYCMATSEYTKQDLIKMGYLCPIDILPILISFSKYNQPCDIRIINNYRDDYINIIFVGRISPNKKQEDIIRAFHFYKKINSKCRLFLIGSDKGMEIYTQRLKRYITALGVENVYFVGHISFKQLLAYYKIADLFLCMSEHEGFCVPLVEAMYFQIPTIAYNSSAVGETLGKSGILVDSKNPYLIACLIDKCVNDNCFKDYLKNKQKAQIKKFLTYNVEKKLLNILENLGEQ